jgi:hypothetical protein
MSRSGEALDARVNRPAGALRPWLTGVAAGLVVSALVAGCDTEEEPDRVAEGQTTIQMNVDATLIDPTQQFEAFGVQLSPPAGWAPLPQDQVDAVAAAVSGQEAAEPTEASGAVPEGGGASDNYRADPLAVFAKPDSGLWLIVSAVNVPEPAVYTARLKEQHERLDQDQFLLRGIEVHQYRSFPDGMVNFKLLVAAPGREDPRRLQLDYVFPLKEYETLGRVLESSIGSLAPSGRGKGA